MAELQSPQHPLEVLPAMLNLMVKVALLEFGYARVLISLS